MLIDAQVRSELVQVIRCNIWLRSIERCRDVENGPISEKSTGYTQRPLFQPPLCFIETENGTLKL
jgi:hypothetical protein